MPEFLCATCGTQHPSSDEPPACCRICDDERQYVGLEGQRWTTLDELRREHHNEFVPLEPRLTAILTRPPFAINQRALLIESPAGNVLWDCIALLDEETVAALRSKGGLAAIAISHPHYYTTMGEWSRAFGGIPVYLHAADREWVVHPGGHIRFWDGGQLEVAGFTLIRAGGHFPGGCLLHWTGAADQRGVLLSGDIIQVVPDRRWVSFMYSYPNLIPLSAATVRRVASSVEPFEFDRVYGAFHPMQIARDGKSAIRRSAERYIRALIGDR
jgi:hypothetical protein